MKVCYANTLNLAEGFDHTENALKSRAWTSERPGSAVYGFTRIPSPSMRKSRKTLDHCSWDYKYSLRSLGSTSAPNSLVATLASRLGMRWDLHFNDASEEALWKKEHFKTSLNLPEM